MQTWIKFVPLDQLVDGQEYFIGWHRNPGNPYHESCSFIGRGLNGKMLWTGKPGIALRLVCDEKFRQQLRDNPSWRAIEIPANADTRWKARKKRTF